MHARIMARETWPAYRAYRVGEHLIERPTLIKEVINEERATSPLPVSSLILLSS